MNRIFEIWKQGWCIIGRVLIFFILLSLFTAPIRILNELLPEPSSSILEWTIEISQIVLLLPFVFYFASRHSGEFIKPRKNKTEPEGRLYGENAGR